MDDAEKRWVGTGATPCESLRDLAPSTEGHHVEWIEGIYGASSRAGPAAHDESRYRDVSIIYESKPMKQWRVELVHTESEWRVVVGKKLDF